VRYLDVCAGISASTVAWRPLGWQAAAYSEIEAAPRAILAHHYPDTPLHGDFTTIQGDEYGPIDLLVGGTPCQDFSISGLRAGLDGDRGNLSLQFCALAGRLRPRWLVWENVRGVLSQDEGRAFGAILGGLAHVGYGFSYRVLDAQFFGLAQRRPRVFVVGYFGDWRPPAAVLLERQGVSGNPAPRREARSGIAGCLSPGAHPGGFNGQDAYTGHLIPEAFGGNDTRGPIDVSTALNSHGGPHGRLDFESETFVAQPFSIMPMNSGRDYVARPVDVAQPLMAGGPVGGNQGGDFITQMSAVRRLTPRECERLQGFPDDYTLVPHRGKPMADSPRYKALGNSMAVPVMRWIGERIAAVDAIMTERAVA
jgi:DNA (cytosine-5)-methyltransferase 1